MTDYGKNLIRIDGTIRNDSGVGIDDRVTVRRVDAIPVERLTLYPAEPLRIEGGEGYLVQLLEGRVVSKGSNFPLNIMGRRVDLVVSSMLPQTDAGIINSNTEIEFTEKAPKSQGSIPKMSYEDIGGLGKEISKVREMIDFVGGSVSDDGRWL